MQRPFDFSLLEPSPPDFVYPDWYRRHWLPDSATIAHLQEQYDRAKRGEPHELPQFTLRHPDQELHQKMSKEFWSEVPKDFDTILDVGCSDGYMVKHFADCGKRAAGVNDCLLPTDDLYIEEHSLDVREGDMHRLEFANGSFDAVWCRHVLEHSFSPMQVLAEIYRVTKPGGYLFIVLPPPPEPPGSYPGHWHQIPDYQLRYLLEMSNYAIDKLWTALFSFERENDNLEIRAICRKT